LASTTSSVNPLPATAPPSPTAQSAAQPALMTPPPRQALPAPAALAAPTQPPTVLPTQNIATATKPAVQPPAAPATTQAAQPESRLPDRAFNIIPVAGGSPHYPATLAVDGRPGDVTVECRIGTDGKPSHCRVVRSNAAPFVPVVLDWLKSGTLRFAPIVHNGEQIAETHRWSVHIEESADDRRAARAAETSKPAVAPPVAPAPPPPAPAAVSPKLVAEAPTPAPGDHPFSPHLLRPSAPDYPEEYADQNATGRVTVSCMIDTNGQPGGCKVLQVVGGNAFGTAVEHWLHSGSVRFAPIVRAGVNVAEQHSWAVEIRP
jgi:TonB family protein